MCENETTQRSNQKWCGRRLKMNKILTMVRQSRRLSSCSSTSETNVYDLNFQHRPGANNINGLVSWLAFDAQTASCGNLNTVRHVRNKFPGVQKTELQARELRKPALASSILFTNFYQCQFYNLPKSLSHDFPRSTGLPYFRWFVSLWAVTETLQQSGVMHAPFSRQRLSGVKGKHAAKRDEQRKRTENPGLQASIEVIRLCHVEAKLFTSNQGWSSQSSHAWKEFALQKVGSQMCIQRRKTQKMLECILERMVEACLADSSRLLFLEHRWCSYFHASVRGVWRQHFKMQTGGTKRCTTYSNISNPVLERWKEGNVEALDQVQAAV